MGCFSSTGKLDSNRGNADRHRDQTRAPPASSHKEQLSMDIEEANLVEELSKHKREYAGETFSFVELARATRYFSSDCLLGEGGFGRVYKAHLDKINQDVAVKHHDFKGVQGHREFAVEVKTLNTVDHPNIVKLIGICAQGDQRLLVYEYMPLGSLDKHLYDRPLNRQPLDWNTRMKIALGAAEGLEYLHTMEPPVIYCDFKSSNILLGEGYHPKLSDFGLAKVGPSGEQTHVSTRVMGTEGYCAPEYAMTGQLTFESDVYSFGVVLLELITGRKAIDDTRNARERNLVVWAHALINDKENFSLMADPLLCGRFPPSGLDQALDVSARCIHENPNNRPVAAELVETFKCIATQTYDQAHPVQDSHRMEITEE